MRLEKFSFGTGDRFGRQGRAQLDALITAQQRGVNIAIVWNKSYREHTIVGTSQADVRREADAAVESRGYTGAYHVDADHIGMATVDAFLDYSDFFTIDVADFIGERGDDRDLATFIGKYEKQCGELWIDGIAAPLAISKEKLRHVAEKYLFATKHAADIYFYIKNKKGSDQFITEVSMDETADPQTPEELLFILAALSDYGVPVQTIAPKFTGRFNKGVDYQGDLASFATEFNQHICVLRNAAGSFNLPANLKLSVHTGSDKFSIYPVIRKAMERHQAGIHLKTAGTTWLEELIGLAEAGGSALDLVKEIYSRAWVRFDELCAPYVSVIDIDKERLPVPETFSRWHGPRVARAIRHDRLCPEYDKNIRQLLHVGFKIAAELGDPYLKALSDHQEIIGTNVLANLFDKHLTPLFL
jgi:hypothetical protein